MNLATRMRMAASGLETVVPPPVVGQSRAWWADDPAWSNPGDGGAVATWDAHVGPHDLAQATASKRPTFNASDAAFNDRATVQGDGTDDFLSVSFTEVSQPGAQFVVAGLSDVDNLITGQDTVKRWLVDKSTGSTIRMFAGTSQTGGSVNESPHIFVARWDTTDELYVDGGTAAISASAGTNTLDGVRIMAAVNNTDFNSKPYAYVAQFDDAVSDADINELGQWAADYYGLSWTDI